MSKNRYNTGANVLCSMILLSANVALEIDSFPSPDKQIFVHPLHCPYKDNRPPWERSNYSINIPKEEDGDRQQRESDSRLDIM